MWRILIKAVLINFLIASSLIWLQGNLLVTVWPSFLPRPNLIMIWVVFASLTRPSAIGAVGAFVLGLMLDLGSAGTLGPSAAEMVLIYGVLGVVASRMLVDSTIALAVMVFLAGIGGGIIYLVLGMRLADSFSVTVLKLMGEAFASALVAPAVASVLRRVNRMSSRNGRAFGTSPAYL